MIKKSVLSFLFVCLATFQVQSRVLIGQALRNARALQQLLRRQYPVPEVQDTRTQELHRLNSDLNRLTR